MGTNCAPLVADMFLFCYEKYLTKYFTKEKRDDMIVHFARASSFVSDLTVLTNS